MTYQTAVLSAAAAEVSNQASLALAHQSLQNMSAAANDFFVVALETPNGEQLPSVDYDGQKWFVGEAGQEFAVTITRSNNSKKNTG